MTRLPPHSIDAERSVLGSMLRDKHTIPNVHLLIKPEQAEEAFYLDSHRRIFQAINRLYDTSSAVDLVLLGNELHRTGDIEDCGGYAYLAKIYDETPTAANATYYAEIVRSKAILRQLIQLGSQVAADASGNVDEADALLQKASARIEALVSRGAGSGTKTIHKELHEILDDFDKPMESCQGYPSGLPEIDTCFQFEPGTLTTVGARPSVGKSLGLIQFAHNLADQGLPTLLMSLEMRRKENVQRLLTLRSASRFAAVRRKADVSPEEFARISNAANELYRLPLVLNCEEQTISSIKAEVLAAKQRHKIKVVCVDYLQLVSGLREKGESRAEEVGKISKGLKRLANDHDLIVIAACQLNRETERGPSRPKLADLRESGSIEQDSDNVILLWREDVTESHDGIQTVKGCIAKQRNGPTAEFELARNAAYMRFEHSYKPFSR